MFFEGFFGCYDTSVAWTVSTVLGVVCLSACIDTLANLGMCFAVSYCSTNKSVKGIEISFPVAVVVCVDVFYHTTVECVEVGDTIFLQ